MSQWTQKKQKSAIDGNVSDKKKIINMKMELKGEENEWRLDIRKLPRTLKNNKRDWKKLKKDGTIKKTINQDGIKMMKKNY